MIAARILVGAAQEFTTAKEERRVTVLPIPLKKERSQTTCSVTRIGFAGDHRTTHSLPTNLRRKELSNQILVEGAQLFHVGTFVDLGVEIVFVELLDPLQHLPIFC